MSRLFSRLSIRSRLTVIALTALVGATVVAGISLSFLFEILIEDRQIKTKHIVQSAYSVIEHFHRQVEQGKLALEQGKQGALQVLKAMRYGADNYLWVNDMQPAMVMHPFKPDLDGRDVSQVKDPTGKRLFMAFVQRVKRDGEGFVHYQWPKPGGETAAPKVSYVKGFRPWGWIIGSGIYLDDVKTVAWQKGQLLGAIFLGPLLLVAVTVWLVGRSIPRPINGLKWVMQRVAEDGNLDRRAKVERSDEVGQMAGAFNDLLSKLQGFVVRVQDEVNRLTMFGDKLSALGVRVFHQMNTVHDETTQAATAMNEMSVSSEDVARNVAMAAEHSKDADHQARSGHETVGQSLSAIEGLASGVREASENVHDLSRNAENIGSIIDVISEIAEQTNLLALNAAIEAARAGDQGRGFAVVADQVRTLAQRTRQSTDDIQQMIESLYRGVKSTTSVMEECLQQTNQSVQRANEAQQALQAITDSASNISDLNTQIASAAIEQSTVSEDINNNITNISTVVGETTRLTEEASELTGSFGASLSEVVQTMGQFHSNSDWRYQLAAGKISHLLWKIRLRGFLDGHVNLSTDEAVSHHQCRFGQWYDQLEQVPPSLKAVERPHALLHVLATEIIQLQQQGRKNEAEARFRKLDEMSSQILQHLDEALYETGAAA